MTRDPYHRSWLLLFSQNFLLLFSLVSLLLLRLLCFLFFSLLRFVAHFLFATQLLFLSISIFIVYWPVRFFLLLLDIHGLICSFICLALWSQWLWFLLLFVWMSRRPISWELFVWLLFVTSIRRVRNCPIRFREHIGTRINNGHIWE